jgi:hypothetical protein
MAEKKFHWKKRHNTGINVLIVDGERRTVKPGDHLEASISELGSFAGQYEPAAPSTRKRALTPLEIETAKHEVPLKEKSIWISPTYRPGIGSIENIPADVKGLREVLAQKESKAPDGEMGMAMMQLHEASKAWAYQVKIDPKGQKSLKEPEGQWLEAIAKAKAALNILQAEIKEIKIRLELAEQAEEKQVNNRAERLRYKGFAQLRNHRKALQERENLVRMAAKGLLSDDEVAAQIKGIREKLSLIGSRIAAIESQTENLPKPEQIKQRASTAARVMRHILSSPEALLEMPHNRKKELVQSAFAGKDKDGRRLGVYVKGHDPDQERPWSFEIRGILETIVANAPISEDEIQALFPGGGADELIDALGGSNFPWYYRVANPL